MSAVEWHQGEGKSIDLMLDQGGMQDVTENERKG